MRLASRQILTAILLVAFGLPACLGTGLHAISDGCCSSLWQPQESGCHDCPFNHDHPPVDTLASDHECPVCDFLTLAKQVDNESDHDSSLHPFVVDQTPTAPNLYFFHAGYSHSARGPPA